MTRHKVFIATAALIVLIVTCFFVLFEPYNEKREKGWHESARRNPFLAAEEYLKSTGMDIASSFSLQELIPLENLDTLFISSNGHIVSNTQESKLIEWVNEGGHLIYTPTETSSSQASTYLLDWLEVEYLFTEYDDWFQDEPLVPEVSTNDVHDESPSADNNATNPIVSANPNPTDSPTPDKNAESNPIQSQATTELSEAEIDEEHLTHLTLSDGIELTVSFDGQFTLYHPSVDDPDYQIQSGSSLTRHFDSENGIHLMEFSVGNGRITVLTDDEIWQNYEIDMHDNAYLLSLLTQNSHIVHFIIGSDMPSLWQLIWRQAAALLISAGVLLALWLFHVARRFTPAKEQPIAQRRSLGEHIHATAQYHWLQGDPLALLEDLRVQVKRNAEVRITGFTRLNQSSQFKTLAEIGRIAPSELADAFLSLPKDEATFTQATRHLQRLEMHLRRT